MGARGSRKVTPKGITAIIDDLNDKLDSYLALAAERQRRLGPRTAS